MLATETPHVARAYGVPSAAETTSCLGLGLGLGLGLDPNPNPNPNLDPSPNPNPDPNPNLEARGRFGVAAARVRGGGDGGDQLDVLGEVGVGKQRGKLEARLGGITREHRGDNQGT